MTNSSDSETDRATEGGGFARETEVSESDPNADSAEGLAGGMGVSSERVGRVRGSDEPATYGARETYEVDPPADAVPEESSSPAAGEEIRPDAPQLKEHYGRLHGNPSAPGERGERRD